jgi:cytochrome c-type biogenesis protein CcsB
LPAVIEMNRELAYGGWRFYQSSYQQTQEREMSVLAVSRDPGEPVAFAGFVLLVGGMCTVLGTRIAQRRALARRYAEGNAAPVNGRVAARTPARAAALLLALAALPAAATAAGREPWLPDPPYVEALRRLVVQHDGRAMPLDTLAREALREVAGRPDWQGHDPVAVVLGWTFDAAAWSEVPMVRVGRPELLALAGLPGASRVSFGELVRSRPLGELTAAARARAARDERLDPLAQAAIALEDRLYRMQGFFQGATLRVVPAADPVAAWSAPALAGPDALGVLLQGQRQGAPAHFPSAAAVEREIGYNLWRPTRLAWWILAPATLAALLTWRRPRRWLDTVALTGLLAGFAVMTWGLGARWAIAGRIPAANMYESMLFLGWGVGLAAALAALVRRNRLVVFNAAAMSALTMALLDLLPIDPFIHPVPPVLAGTPWLAIHVPIIMVSYSVLALAVLVAHMQVGLTIFAPRRHDLAERMQDLLYWYMHVGSILLLAGILTGSMWASSSWGRYWGWDPKEVWSLIAFLAYMAILHGRFDRLIGPYGVAAASIVAFWGILMTYVGVNYILAAGLHSYGFGGGGVASWMLGLATAEAAFLALGWAAARRQRQALPAPA